MSFINTPRKRLWYSWLPGCGSSGSPVSNARRKREIGVFIAGVLGLQFISFVGASLWLTPYAYTVFTLAKPLLNAPSYQTILSVDVSDGGAKVNVQKELKVSSARFPGMESTLQQAYKDKYAPDRTFTFNTVFDYEIPGRLSNLSILPILIFMLPRKRFVPKLKGLLILTPFVVLAHVFIVFILDVAKMMYFSESTFFTQNFIAYSETISYYNWVVIFFLWFVYGVLTHYESSKQQA